MWDAKVFKKRLGIARAFKGWSQVELAKAAGVGVQSLSRWVRGLHPPEIDSVMKLAHALGRPTSWLLGEGEESAGIPAAPAAIPTPNPLPIDRRAEIPVFKIVKREHAAKAVGVPKWLDLAAGEGKELSLCDDLIYFDPKDNFKGLQTAEVRGESMIKTLFDGDIIVLKQFPSGGIELPALESEDEKTSLATWQAKHDIREGDICVLSIRHEAPTLKRVHYDTRRGPKNWKLQIRADNPAAWEMFQADTSDTVVFYAKMIARAEE